LEACIVTMHVASLSTINHKVRIYGVVDYSVIILLQICCWVCWWNKTFKICEHLVKLQARRMTVSRICVPGHFPG